MDRKKIAIVVPPVDFDDEAFWTVRRMLDSQGHKVVVTSLATGSAMSDQGRSTLVDVPIRDLKTWEWDAWIFIGGPGARIYFDNERVQALIKDVKYKPLGATGAATVPLARAEACINKNVTGDPEYAALLIASGAVFTNKPFETSDKLVTLQDSSLAVYFVNAFTQMLESGN